ncbi:MAG TPA: hypothetical protein PKJ99_09725 [Thermoanaerobaculales bacterium]|nr:hypothetical protein [Thermoanaerobaculales bacterium]HQP33741.1 hypothetical protein [Polyangiaceae bacterium]
MGMLYFTSRSTIIDAIYTGRFAFISRGTADGVADALSALLHRTEGPDRAVDNAARDDLTASFLEEHRHAQLFLSCNTGLILSGLLFFVRAAWLLFRTRRVVYEYYRLRAVFYAIMYPIHEHAVHETLERLSVDEEISAALRENVSQADAEVRARWNDVASPVVLAMILLCSPIFRLLGRIVARHFTVVSQEYDDGQLWECNHALSGIVNDLYADRPSAAPLPIRRLLRSLRPESVIPNTMQTD